MWKKPGEDKAMPSGEAAYVLLNGKLFMANADGTWSPQTGKIGLTGRTRIKLDNSNYDYEWNGRGSAGEDGWEKVCKRGFPTGNGDWDSLPPEDSDKEYKWIGSGDVIYLPGANGKMLKG